MCEDKTFLYEGGETEVKDDQPVVETPTDQPVAEPVAVAETPTGDYDLADLGCESCHSCHLPFGMEQQPVQREVIVMVVEDQTPATIKASLQAHASLKQQVRKIAKLTAIAPLVPVDVFEANLEVARLRFMQMQHAKKAMEYQAQAELLARAA